MVEADAGMMEQVLLNLAVNARDAMPQAGASSPSAWHRRCGRRPHGCLGSPPGRFVCLSVSDTGMGIPPENLRPDF